MKRNKFSEKKIMILGAGLYQVPLIRAAKKMGLTTIAVSVAGNYPGFEEADIPLYVDLRKKEKILEKAKDYRINAIVTNQTNIGVKTVAFVAERLGLPGIGLKCARKFDDKFLMRKACERLSINSAYYKVSSLSQTLKLYPKLKKPFVIKPTRNQGGRGVFIIKSKKDLITHFSKTKGYSFGGEILLEDYIEGKEVIVQGLMNDGLFTNLVIGDYKYYAQSATRIPQSLTFPSSLSNELVDKVYSLNKKIVEEFKLPFGLTDSEFIVNEKTKKVFLIEIGARGGGTFISSDLVPLACGVDVEDILLQQTLGLKFKNAFKLQERAAAYYFASLTDGFLADIRGMKKAGLIKGVHKIFWNLRVGDEIKVLDNKTSRKCLFLIKGKSRSEIDRTIREIQKTVTFSIKNKHNTVTVSA